ncbi:hypothetical protein [Hydrocarboniphaga sp.]|uniref:hypothetical protein n=1 Tax=Hydrocarboniphaga sp. TaxID=2033016 RepID=UPI003D141D2A
MTARTAVPISQQVAFYAAELARSQTRLQKLVNGAHMSPEHMENILRNMRAVLATLRQVEQEQGQ